MSKRKSVRLNAAQEIVKQARSNLHWLHHKGWTPTDHLNAQRWRRYANDARNEKAIRAALTRWLRAAGSGRKAIDRARSELAEMLERAPGSVRTGRD